MQYIFVSVPGNQDTCERESENQQHVILSREFNLISRDSVLTLQKHFTKYTAKWPVLISLSINYLKINLKAEEKLKVNQYEVSIDNKAYVIDL